MVTTSSRTVLTKRGKQGSPKRRPVPTRPRQTGVSRGPNSALIQRALNAPQTLTPNDVKQLQHTVGNQAVQRMLNPNGAKGVIQRKLPDSKTLIGLGGKAGWKWFGKSAFKKILLGVDVYNKIPDNEFDRRLEQLAQIGEEIANWFNSPERAKKTGSKQEADEKKATMLEGLQLLVNREMQAVVRERLQAQELAHQERVGRIGQQAVKIGIGATTRQMKEANVTGQTPEELKESALTAYGQDMDKIKAGDEKTKGRTPTAFDWRGTSDTAKMASVLGEVTGRNYFQNVLLPAFSNVLRLKNEEAEVNPDKINAPQNDKPGIIQQNANRLKQVYAEIMALFTVGGAAAIPPLFSQFCAQLYQLALDKGMDQENAYLLVSSQVFLRTINPMVTNIVSAIPLGEAGRTAAVYIAKLLQNEANNVTHGGGQKEKFMSIFGDINYQDQIHEFVEEIIRLGQEL